MPVVDEGTTHTKELLANKKGSKLKENTSITWKCNASPHYKSNCLFEGGAFYQFDGVNQLSNIPMCFDCDNFVGNIDI